MKTLLVDKTFRHSRIGIRQGNRDVFVEWEADLIPSDNGAKNYFRSVLHQKPVVSEEPSSSNVTKLSETLATYPSHYHFEWDIATDQVEWAGDIDGLLGLKQGEFPRNAQGMSEFLHSDDRNRFLDAVIATMATDTPFKQVYRLRRNDGEYITVLSQGKILKNDEGIPVRWIGVNIDLSGTWISQFFRSLEKSELIEAPNSTQSNRDQDAFTPDIWSALQDLRSLANAQGNSSASPPGSKTESETAEMASGRGRLIRGEDSFSLDAAPDMLDERFEVALKITEDLVFEWNVEYDRVSWFGNIDHLMGHSPGRFPRTSKELLDLVHPADRPSFLNSVLISMKSGTLFHQESQIQDQDGNYRIISSRGVPFRNKEGRVVKWLGVISDITGQREAEKALQKSESRYRFLTEHSNDVVWSMGMDLRYSFLSPSVFNIFGITPEEALKRTLDEIMPPRSLNRLLSLIQNGTEDDPGLRNPKVIELEMYRADGSILWAEISFSLVRGENNAPAEIIGATRDITKRKLAEEALRVSEERFRTAAHIANDVVFERDFETGTAMYYGDIDALHGYAPGEFPRTMEGWCEVCHPDDLNHMLNSVREQFLSEKPIAREFRSRKKDGTYLHWIDHYQLIKNKKGLPHKWIGVQTNITEQKIAEQKLKESEERYRTLIENQGEGFVTMDLSGKFLFANPAAEEIFGVSLGTLQGRRLDEFTTEDSFQWFLEQMEKRRAGQKNTYELTIINANKDKRHLLITGTPQRDKNGIVHESLAVFRDMTEWKKAKESEIHHARDLSFLSSTAMRFIEANPEEDIYKLIGEQIFEQIPNCFIILNEYDPATDSLICRHLFGMGKRLQAVMKFLDGDIVGRNFKINETVDRRPMYSGKLEQIEGGVAELSFNTIPASIARMIEKFLGIKIILGIGFVYKDRLFGNAIFILREDTELRTQLVETYIHQASIALQRKYVFQEKLELEEQFRHAQKMEAVGRLAGGISHDFNNILTGITGYAEVLLHSLDPDDPKTQDVLEIQKAAERAVVLTSQLLAFSRKQIIDPKVIDLNSIITTSINMLKRLIGENILLEFKPGEEFMLVKSDVGQIEQVLVNLVINAKDAISGGGVISLETRNTLIDQEFCRKHAEAATGHYAMLVVSDTGAGMNENTLQHCFEPFFTTKDKGKGTGLGLSTVYGIVKQCGGFITVHSLAGKGSNFRIFFPAVKGDLADETTVVPEDPPTGRENILLVEDEEMVRNLARKILERQGYRVLSAACGEEAIQIAEKEIGSIDLLLTDVIMPNMNGRELGDRLELLKPGIPVLFMSGYTADVIAQHGVLEEGTNYLKKPFTIRSLSTKVREVLDQSRPD
jgi:PAS domain S-box-containing protein